MIYGAMNFPVKPVIDELEVISELGFDYMELTLDPPQAHYTLIAEQRDTLMKELETRKMKVVCHLPTFLQIADLTESLRSASIDEMFKSLEVAATLNPLKVVLHPGYIVGLGPLVSDRARKYASQSLEAIVGKADSLGTLVCLENMFPRVNSLTTPDDFVEPLQRFPDLMLTLDTGHANIGGKGERRILEFIDRFPDRIGHVHASDNFGKEDNHLPLGVGIIDFPKIVKALKRVGYDGTVTFEVFSRDKEYLRISRDKFAEMLRNSP